MGKLKVENRRIETECKFEIDGYRFSIDNNMERVYISESGRSASAIFIPRKVLKRAMKEIRIMRKGEKI